MLEGIIETPRLLEIDEVDVAAPAAAVWNHIRHADLAPTRAIRALFALRTLPAQLRGEPAPGALRIDDLRSSPGRPGFGMLRDAPPHEVVVGAIGKVWKLNIPFVHVASAQDFAAFAEPGFVKVAWAIRVWPLDEQHSRIEFELCVSATDEASWRKFRRYFRVIGPWSRTIRRSLLRSLESAIVRQPRSTVRDVLEGAGGAALMVAHLATPFLRRPRTHWGLDETYAARSLPGDELVPEPLWSYTHGVEIEAPASAVWPWVAQIGANRAGFYSYQWLENLLGCALVNADSIHPEWQIREGDRLSLHPKLEAMRVARYEHEAYFVAFAPADELARAEAKPWSTGSWLFLVEPLGDRRCALISRYRAACSSDVVSRISFGPALLEPISFAMDRRMLLGVKERAERQAACA